MKYVIPHYDRQTNLQMLGRRLQQIEYNAFEAESLFNDKYGLYLRAYQYEKEGDYETALDFYYWLLYTYSPGGAVYFERPAIILEKLKRYEEAVIIVQMQIKLARHPDAHLDPAGALKRLRRLNSKVHNDESVPETTGIQSKEEILPKDRNKASYYATQLNALKAAEERILNWSYGSDPECDAAFEKWRQENKEELQALHEKWNRDRQKK